MRHYNAIGLLRPSERAESGYRRYTRNDMERLHQILVLRELGFSLPDVGRIMNDPGSDRRRALGAQRELLSEKLRRGSAMLAALDAALRAPEKGMPMQTDDLFEGFGDFDPTQYEDEARQRWGHSRAYKESARRTASYSKDDWRRITAEASDIAAAFARAMQGGVPPDDPSTQALVERHRHHLATHFYEPTLDVYDGLAALWVQDRRFSDTIDRAGEGLAEYQRAAVKAWVAKRRAQDGT